MSNPFVICFAGVSGCGKSSIAHELSIELAIPRFELDKIRQEVKDDGRSRRI
jgi:2-phosphoglycerate kinase